MFRVDRIETLPSCVILCCVDEQCWTSCEVHCSPFEQETPTIKSIERYICVILPQSWTVYRCKNWYQLNHELFHQEEEDASTTFSLSFRISSAKSWS